MNEFRRKQLPHTPPAWVKSGSEFFITICSEPKGSPLLLNNNRPERILESASFYNNSGKWFCSLMLIMPDHLHALISFPSDSDLTKTISSWKSYHTRNTGIKWQRNFFDHRIRNDKSHEEKAHYIRMNPARKGLCSRTEEWEYVFNAQ